MNDRPLVLPLVAGLAALAGAVLTLVSLFSDYYEDFIPSRQFPALLWFFLVYSLAVLAAGVLLVSRRQTQVVGAAALVVIVTTFVGWRANGVYNVSQAERGAGPGFTFDLAGFVLVVVAAVLAAIGLVGARDPELAAAPGVRSKLGLATAAAVCGFVTAVGFGLNPSQAARVPSEFGQGTPLIPSPRSLWGQLMVVVALTAWPVVIVLARRRVAAGLTLGLLAFVLAEALYRLLSALTSIRGVDPMLDAIEGTWVFVLGGIALVAILLTRLGLPDAAPDVAKSSAAAPAGPA